MSRSSLGRILQRAIYARPAPNVCALSRLTSLTLRVCSNSLAALNPIPSVWIRLRYFTLHQVDEAALPYFLCSFSSHAEELEFCWDNNRGQTLPFTPPTQLPALKILRCRNLLPAIFAPFLTHLTVTTPRYVYEGFVPPRDAGRL